MHVLLGKRSCNGTVAKSKTHLLLIGPQRAARWPSSNIGSPILFWHSHASKWSYSRSWNRCKTKKDGLTGMPLLMFLTSWGSGIVLIALVSGIVLIALGLGIRNRSHDIHRSQAHWCTGSFSPHWLLESCSACQSVCVKQSETTAANFFRENLKGWEKNANGEGSDLKHTFQCFATFSLKPYPSNFWEKKPRDTEPGRSGPVGFHTG